jgi:hypothetical protein
LDELHSRSVRLDSQSVIHGSAEFLFARQVALCRLNRHMTPKKLDLVQFSAGQVAQTRAGSPKVVRSEFRNVCAHAAAARTTSQSLGGHPKPAINRHLKTGN